MSPPPKRVRLPNPTGRKLGITSSVQTTTVPPPPTATERYLVEEQEVTRVEQLMIKGVRMPHEILKLLSMQPNQIGKVVRWMKMARARWDVYVDGEGVRTALADELASLANLEQELWLMYQGIKDDDSGGRREKIVIFEQLRRIYRQRADLRGLSKENITAATQGNNLPIPMLRSMHRQDALVDALVKIGEFAAMKKGIRIDAPADVVDVDFTQEAQQPRIKETEDDADDYEA